MSDGDWYPSEWTSLGVVHDGDGNDVEVSCNRHGALLIEHVMGSLEIGPVWMPAFRELLDRAAMPALTVAAVTPELAERMGEIADAAQETPPCPAP